MDAELLNPRAVPGDNHPPVELSPYDLSHDEIQDLYDEAIGFLDGAPVDTQEMADAIGKLKKDTAAAMARADERRKAEAKPYDDAKAEIQARYNTLIGDTKAVKGLAVMAIQTCNEALKPFLATQAAEIERKAREAREEAEARRRIADDALRASRDDLAARQRAEQLLTDAKAAEKTASRAEKERPAVRGGGRAITMRKVPVAVLADPVAALRHAREAWPDDLKAWLRDRAQRDMDGGRLTIPGFDASYEERLA